MVASQDDDAPAGAADTDASTLCDWTVWNDIIGAQSVANLPSGWWSSVLCGYGTEAGSSNICIYDALDHFELLYELLHATCLDSYGGYISDAGGNSLSG